MAARDEVMGTVELLEEILLRQPMLELVRKQRICTAWRDCIKGSIRIQRKLFLVPLEPHRAPRIQKYANYSVQLVRLNPLLANSFHVKRSEISGSSIYLRPPEDKRKLQNVRCTESVLRAEKGGALLEDVNSGPVTLGDAKFYGQYKKRRRSLSSIRRQLGFTDTERLPVASGQECSSEDFACDAWSSMLATQPPVSALSIRADNAGGLGDRGDATKILAADGSAIRLGDVVKAAAVAHKNWQIKARRCNVEMEIFQPLEVTRAHQAVVVDSNGMKRYLDLEDDDRFLRAWRTRLHCNFG